MLFNFNNSKEEILKLFLEQKELNIIFTDSYSLYNIKNKDSNYKKLCDIYDLYMEWNLENFWERDLLEKIKIEF